MLRITSFPSNTSPKITCSPSNHSLAYFFWWSSRKPSDTVSMVKMVCTHGWLWMIYLENPRKKKVIFHGQIYEFIMIRGIIGYVRESNAMICLFSAMIFQMTIATGLNSWTDPFWIGWGSRVWNIRFMKRNTSGNLKWKTSLGIMTKFLKWSHDFLQLWQKGAVNCTWSSVASWLLKPLNDTYINGQSLTVHKIIFFCWLAHKNTVAYGSVFSNL